MPKPEYFGIEVDRRTVGEVLAAGGPDPIGNFLRESFQNRLRPQLLGFVTKFWERLAYAENNISSCGVLIMAASHDILIDWLKNGYRYDRAAFERFIRGESRIRHKKPPDAAYEVAMNKGLEIAGITKFTDPSESESNFEEKKDPKPNLLQPNDFLFFQVIRPQLVHVIAQFKKLLASDKSHCDPHLTSLYQESVKSASKAKQSEVKSLKKKLGDIRYKWNHHFTPSSKKGIATKTVGTSAQVIEECYLRFQNLMPVNPNHPDIAPWMIERLNGEPSYWALLKASALYHLHQRSRTSMIFHLAGSELGYIKAHSTKNVRNVVDSIWANYRPGKVKAATLLYAPSFSVSGPSENGNKRIIEEDSIESIDDDDFYSTIGHQDDDS